MTIALPSRALALRPFALCSAVATLAVALVAVPTAPASTAAADTPSCLTPVADYPNVHGQVYGAPWGFYGVDPEVGVYIAGDWDVLPGAAEAEGTIVVEGDATFDSGVYFNLGTVGLGSQVSAGAFTDMLTTGGSIEVASTTTLDVGNHRGGNLVAGGSITPPLPSAKYELNGGTASPGAAVPLAGHTDVPLYYQGLSADLAALPVGSTTVDLVTDPGEVRFIGDGVSTRQVFSVSGAALGTDASQKGIAFSNIPVGAIIVVNVTGATAELAWGFSMNGAALDFSAAEPDRVFSGWTQSIAWNFPTATDVTLGLNGQLPGSVLIPTTGSILDLRTSINGRLYVNGDVSFGGAGTTGLEIHNYPLRAECAVGTGSFVVGKTITDPDAVAEPTRVYTGTYECLDALGGLVDDGAWALEAGDTVTISGLPVGAQCSVTEDAGTLTAAPSPTDPGYSWGTPTYSAASVAVTASMDVGITVNNVVLHEVGGLRITKSISDPDAVVPGSRTFTGTYSCLDSGSTVVASGSWSLGAGLSTTITGIPAGAECTVQEDPSTLTVDPSSTDSSYRWATPAYSPATVAIADGGVADIGVQNEVLRGLGDLEMVKILDDPYDVVDLSRVYTGTWDCILNAASIESGTWSTVAGAAPLTLATDLPAGAVCSLAEDAATLTAPPLAGFPQYVWQAPVISPATVTIAEGGIHRITVTNIVYDPIGEVSALAHAGTDSVRWLLAGGAIAAGGILLVYFARRRRIV